MTGGGPYPTPADRAEFDRWLASPASEERLHAAMASFRMPDPDLKSALAGRLVAEGNNLVKATLVKAVGRFGDPAYLDLLGGYLTDPDDRVRANTVEALGFFRDPRVVTLVNPLIYDESSRVRGNALLVLGRFHQAKTLAYVEKLLGHADPGQRETAVYVLSRIGGAYGAGRLAGLLMREADPKLRRAAFGALAALARKGVPEAQAAVRAAEAAAAGVGPAGSPAAPPGIAPPGVAAPAIPAAPATSSVPRPPPEAPVAETPTAHAPAAAPPDPNPAEDGGPPETPAAAAPAPAAPAAAAIEAGAGPAAAPDPAAPGANSPGEWPPSTPPRPPDDGPRYPDDLTAAAPRRRLEAVQLAPDHGREHYERLSEMLEQERDDFVIATLVKKLGKVGGPAAAPQIKAYLRSEDGRVRANTLEGLEAAQAPDLLEVCRALLEDLHPRVRAQAARILASQKAEQGKAVAVLKEMILADDPQGALSAVHALESIDAGVILEVMELALVQPQPRLKGRVLMALKVMGEKNALAARLAQRYSGGEGFEDEDYVNRLLSRMNSKDAEVRYDALKRLSLIRSPRVQSRIELATSDASEKVRNLAKAQVEDFGKVYKRQGILHSLGLRAVELLKTGEIQLEGARPTLDELDGIVTKLAAGQEGTNAASSLLTKRRELLVTLGERVFRERPGLNQPGVRELLEQLRALEDAPEAAARPAPTAADEARAAAELDETMRRIEAGEGAAPAATIAPASAPVAAGPETGFRLTRIPKHVFLLAVMMAVVGGIGLFVSGRLRSGLMGSMRRWTVPLGGAAVVDQRDGFGFAVTADRRVVSVALPTGTEKWSRAVENLDPSQVLARDGRVFVATRLDHLMALSAGKGEVLWSQPAGGRVLPGLTAGGGLVLLGVSRSDGKHELQARRPADGTRRWAFELSTGAPAAITVSGGAVYLVSGATLFRLDLASGKEGMSFDFGDDFLSRGRLAVTGEGLVIAATRDRLVSVNAGGFEETQGAPRKDVALAAHPVALGRGRFGVWTAKDLWVVDANLLERRKLVLPRPPAHTARTPGGAIYVSDGRAEVIRLAEVDGEYRVAGRVTTGGPVRSLAAVGEHLLVGASQGIELHLLEQFE